MSDCNCNDVRRDCERKVDDERYERERAIDSLRNDLRNEIRELYRELSDLREQISAEAAK
jgi:hypothetical protein